MSEHRFGLNGLCIWCSTPTQPVSRECVADRRASPYCEELPQDVRDDRWTKTRRTANDVTGY